MRVRRFKKKPILKISSNVYLDMWEEVCHNNFNPVIGLSKRIAFAYQQVFPSFIDCQP